MVKLLAGLIILISCWSAAPAQGAVASRSPDACDVPLSAQRRAPRPAAGPVMVEVEFVLIDVIEVNDAAQTFKVDFVFLLQWKDPRLSAAARSGATSDCRFRLDGIWHPDVRFVNQRALIRSLGEAVEIDEVGTVRYQRQVLGEFSATLDLREFPFDRQTLRIQAASFEYGPDTIRFAALDQGAGGTRRYSVAGWSVEGNTTDPPVAPLHIGVEEFSRIDHVIAVQRQPGYYLWNFVVPLGLIVAHGLEPVVARP
jgi:hypothetical protein